MLSLRSILAALAVVLVASGVVWPRAEAQQEAPAGIVRLLDDHGRAFEAHDPDLLAGTVTPALRDGEVGALEDAAEIRFASYDLEVVTRYSGDIAYSRVEGAYPGMEVASFHVVRRTQVDGVETEPFVEDLFATFTRSRETPDDPYDGWRLASTDDFEPLGIFSPHDLWEEGHVSVRRSEHFEVWSHPDRADELSDVLEQAEGALEEAASFWPPPTDARYVVIVPSSTAELGRILQATVDLEKFVAFAAGSVDQVGGWEPAGVRIFINLPNFRRYDEAGRRSILAHELIHAVTRPASGPHIPVWVEEGLAMMGSEATDNLSSARRGPTPGRLPPDDTFYVGEVVDIVSRYSQAQVAMDVLRERSGMEAVVAFYRELGAARVVPGTDRYHTERAAGAVDWSLDGWTEDWRGRLG